MILLFLHFDFPAEQELIALREVTQSDMRPAAGCQLGLDRVGDGKSVLVCPDADMERMPVTDLVVLHGILDQQLDRHRRQRLRQGFGSAREDSCREERRCSGEGSRETGRQPQGRGREADSQTYGRIGRLYSSYGLILVRAARIGIKIDFQQ